MTLEVKRLDIPGALELYPPVVGDERGRFVKIFSKTWFEKNGLNTEFVEDYYSVSALGVIRGLHFQVPPMEHIKLVYCVAGEVVDVLLDIRVGSPTYGSTMAIRLSAEKGNLIYIPSGIAHGFCVTSETATVCYKTTSLYSPEYDQGIRWDSVGISWPCDNPLISQRDRGLSALAEFQSPFTYE